MSHMYTPGEIRIRRTIKSIFWSIIILMTAINLVTSYKEKQILIDNGYSRQVNVGDYKLNVAIFGNDCGAHRIVGIAGLQHGDFSVHASRLTEILGENQQMIFIDRVGYGLSDDTFKSITVDRVVEDYRQALKMAGVSAPYVLLAEHYGGVYATYWESCYPNEVEAVIFIDGTEMHESEAESRQADNTPYWLDACMSFASRIGASRVLQTSKYPVYTASYSPEERTMGKGLTASTLDSLAPVVESSKQWDNIEMTHAAVTRNDIPKLYITSDEQWRHKAPTTSSSGGQDFGDVVRLTVKDPGDTLTPYLDQMGNCRLTYLGGIGHLYEYKAPECAQIIQSFLSNLEHYQKVAVN